MLRNDITLPEPPPVGVSRRALAISLVIALLVIAIGLALWLTSELKFRAYRDYYRSANYVWLQVETRGAHEGQFPFELKGVLERATLPLRNPLGKSELRYVAVTDPQSPGSFVYVPAAYVVGPHFDPATGDFWMETGPWQYSADGTPSKLAPGEFLEVPAFALVFYGPQPPASIYPRLKAWSSRIHSGAEYRKEVERALHGSAPQALSQIDWNAVNYAYVNDGPHLPYDMYFQLFLERHPEVLKDKEKYFKERPSNEAALAPPYLSGED